jgi:Ca2+-binding RTX toxin-like protein
MDLLGGGTGDDVVVGGDGEDRIDGGFGDDMLSGGDDGDLIAGGAGNDTIAGGAGADTLLFHQDDVGVGEKAIDVIAGWDASDVIALCATPGGEPFTVTGVSIGFYDNYANLETDVAIGLSNDQYIILLDVATDGDGNPVDWVAGTVDPEAANADNFVRPAAEDCAIDIDIL